MLYGISATHRSILKGMPLPDEKSTKDLVNSILVTLGMKPNNKFGGWVLLIVVVIAVVAAGYAYYIQIIVPERIITPPFTASLYQREYPADKNIINLGGYGTLRPFGNFENPNPSQQVTLALNWTVTVMNKMMAPKSDGAAYFYPKQPEKKDLYTFDVLSQRSHEIKTEGRTFLVTLMVIKDLSENPENPFDTNYEYQFTVSEK